MFGWLFVDVIDLRAVLLGLFLFAACYPLCIVTRIVLASGASTIFSMGSSFSTVRFGAITLLNSLKMR